MMKSIFALIWVLILMIPVSHAAEWALTGTLNPSISYDDNVFLSANKTSSFKTTISPTAFFSRTQDNNSQSLNLGYAIERYTSLSNLNRADPFINFNSDFQTGRSNWGLAASYVKSSSRNRKNAVNDTGDFRTDSTLTSKTISPSYTYQLTEKDSVSLGGNYSKRDYSTTAFSNNKSKSVNTGWQHQFSERFRGGLLATVSNYKSKGLTSSIDDNNYDISITANYDFTELWQIGGKVGIRRLNSKRTDSFGVIDKNNTSGTSFDVNANRQTERDTLSLGLSRAVTPSSLGDVNETDRVSLSWSRSLTETLTARLSTSYQKITSASNQTSGDRKYIDFLPSVTWQFQRNMGVDLSYNYQQQKRSNLSTNARSNAVMMTFNYDWDGLRASR